MKVLHIAAWDFGGAGNAAYRLHQGLQQIGVDSHLLCYSKTKDDPTVHGIFHEGNQVRTQNSKPFTDPTFTEHFNRWKNYKTLPGSDPSIELFSDTLSQVKLLDLQIVQEADILNFHWMPGILNMAEFPELARQKKIVWTLHDMNAFTGGCHFADLCTKYQSQCQSCAQIGQDQFPGQQDLATSMFDIKRQVYSMSQMTIVTPSVWLRLCSQKSATLGDKPHKVIPNSLDVNVFKPINKAQSRQALGLDPNGKYLLFTAVSAGSKRKGFEYLVEALKLLPPKYHSVKIIVMGNYTPGSIQNCPLDIIPLGHLSDINKVAMGYNAADVFAIPSLEDNLPNVVLESEACGVPVVGFDIGGIPDMVTHGETGYLVERGDVQGFARGICFLFDQLQDPTQAYRIQQNCVANIHAKYLLEQQSSAYKSVYDSLLSPESNDVKSQLFSDSKSNSEQNLLESCFSWDLNKSYDASSNLIQFISELLDEPNKLLYLDLLKFIALKDFDKSNQIIKELRHQGSYLPQLKYLEDEHLSSHQEDLLKINSDYQIEGLVKQATKRPYKVSALVSTYASEKFIRGCLEDLESQTIANQVEIIVINSGSPEDEDSIIREFLDKYDNITYIHTEREKLYTAWNRGIKIAQGEYITNANTDDRHRPDCLEVLAKALDSQRDKAVAFGNCIITNTPNGKWGQVNIINRHEWVGYDYVNLLRKCEVGPQPMWRRSIHDEIGGFDDKFRVVGDYEMWLRIGEKYDMIHIPDDLGLYLQHDNNLEHQNQEGKYLESAEVKFKYIERFSKSSSLSRQEIQNRIQIHVNKVSQFLEIIRATQKIENYNEFEFHYYSLIFLKYLEGEIQEAKSLCYNFLNITGDSKNIAHIYRKLLVEPSPKRFQLSHEPLISIIVPLYNQGIYMEDTIQSVISQSYTYWELIIVNDGSTDDSFEVTQEIIKRYPDRKITLLTHENRGKTFTRNKGVDHCSGEYICILDSDDQIASTYLETAAKIFAENPDTGWITPQTLQFGPLVNRLMYNFQQDFIKMLTVCLAPVSAMYRKTMYDDVNGYSEMFTREDWEFWIKAGERGWQGVVTPDVEFLYRIKENRWGLKPENNQRSKTDLYNLHPWWYKNLNEEMRNKVFAMSMVGSFPSDYLDEGSVRIFNESPKNTREDIMTAIERVKANFHHRYPNFVPAVSMHPNDLVTET